MASWCESAGESLVAARGEALREAYAAGTAWVELTRRFGVTPARIIELSKR